MLRSLPLSYTNVPEVQVERTNYINLEQPKNEKETPQQTDYTSLTGMDPPNMYDVIPDCSTKQRKEESQHEPGERKFSLMTKESEDGESVFCTRKDCGMWLMLFIVSIVAVLALVLGIYVFRVNSVCNSNCPNSKYYNCVLIPLFRCCNICFSLSPKCLFSSSLYPSFLVLISLSFLPLLIVTTATWVKSIPILSH